MHRSKRSLAKGLSAFICLVTIIGMPFVADGESRRRSSPSGGGATSSQNFQVIHGACVMTSRAGPRRAPIAGASTSHGGIDLKPAGRGAGSKLDLFAPCSGPSTFSPRAGACGGMLKIRCQDSRKNCEVKLCHLKSSNAKGQVKVGQKVGVMGRTGLATGVHVHVEIRCGGRNISSSFNGNAIQRFCSGQSSDGRPSKHEGAEN